MAMGDMKSGKTNEACKEIKADILGINLAPILMMMDKCKTEKDFEVILHQIWENPEYSVPLRRVLAYVLKKVMS